MQTREGQGLRLMLRAFLFVAIPFMLHGCSSIQAGFSVGRPDFVLKRDLVLEDRAGNVRLRLNADTGNLLVFDPDGNQVAHFDSTNRTAWLGGNGDDGDVLLRPRDAEGNEGGEETIHLDSDRALLLLGGEGEDGKLVLRDTSGNQTVFGNGELGQIILGQAGVPGDLRVRTEEGQTTVRLDGESGLIRGREISLTTGGIRFADGTTQQTAILTGPRGPEGPTGPQGPPGDTLFVNCVDGSAEGQGACGCGSGRFISQVFTSGAGGPCTADTDTGATCSASGFTGRETSGFHNAGSCCVCGS